MKALRAIAVTCTVLLAGLGIVGAQAWTPLNTQPHISASNPLLLGNGQVLVHDAQTSDWWLLTPDINGSYQNGTWSRTGVLPKGYTPLYFASAVLPDSRVVILGGEVNQGQYAWTNLGAIFTLKTKKWALLTAPSGWTEIGDAQSAILANGTFMVADPFNTQDALLDAANLTWTITGTGKNDANDEEGWTLLPSGEVLTVDTNTGTEYSETYNPATGSWSAAGSTVADLVAYSAHEIGPAILRPDGTVLYTGATGQNAIYDSNTGVWSAAPDFPLNSAGKQLDIADGPAALLPSGNVLVMTSPGVYGVGAEFFEWNGSTFNPVPGTPNAPDDSSYYGNMLVLPTGQILLTDFSTNIELYTSSGSPNPAWAPTITSVPTTLKPNTAYTVQGTQLNGLSQGAAYGDDVQAASNYPLVRIINNATGHVFYCLTDEPSSMGVATGSLIVSASFTLPRKADIELGASQLEVVTNGIASAPVSVTVIK
jgi:hypothetical protein